MNRNIALAASLARTVNGNTQDFSNEVGPCGQFVIDITAVAGTAPTCTFTIEGLDPVSGKYYALLASAVLNAAGTTVLRVAPGCPVTANLSANDVLPALFRIKWVVGGATPSFTFTLGASVAG